MPSFTSIATLALALFSAVPALAASLGSVEGDLIQRANVNLEGALEKRWSKKEVCKTSKHCKTHVKHASPICHSGYCSFTCNKGYHVTKDGTCAPVEKKSVKCGKTVCPKVENGWSKCEHGKCKQYCETHSGNKLYTNKHKTEYKCVNVESDKNNCGKPGHVCPYGYHHKGEPICVKGKCSLNCHGYKVAKTHSGVLYCSHKKA